MSERKALIGRMARRVATARLYDNPEPESPAADWYMAMEYLSDAEQVIRMSVAQLQWVMDRMEARGEQWVPADMILAVQQGRAFLGMPRAVPVGESIPVTPSTSSTERAAASGGDANNNRPDDQPTQPRE